LNLSSPVYTIVVPHSVDNRSLGLTAGGHPPAVGQPPRKWAVMPLPSAFGERWTLPTLPLLLQRLRPALHSLWQRHWSWRRADSHWGRLLVHAGRGLLAAALTLTGCAPASLLPTTTPTLEQTVLRLYSTTSAAPLAADLLTAYRQVAPNVQFDLITGDHELLLAAARSPSQPPTYLLTHHLPPDQPGTPPVWGAPIAQDALLLITSGAAAPTSLTRDQIRLIFAGWLDNWAAVGGADAPITVVTREDSSGLQAEFDALILGSRAITPTAQIAPSSPALIARVGRIPAAIGTVSAGALAADPDAAALVRPLAVDGSALTPLAIASGAYPLRMFLYLTGAGEPDGAYRQFIAWVQGSAGQAVVARRYFTLPQ